jgi:hypothetical protein
VIRSLVITTCAILCLTACGATQHVAITTTPKQCVSGKAIAKLDADLVSLRHAASLPTKNTFLGSAAINHATDRFLNDVELAHITNLKRNRMIDHAAGALANMCAQCFQALEAARPNVSIRGGDEGC